MPDRTAFGNVAFGTLVDMMTCRAECLNEENASLLASGNFESWDRGMYDSCCLQNDVCINLRSLYVLLCYHHVKSTYHRTVMKGHCHSGKPLTYRTEVLSLIHSSLLPYG
jgi:hypothetical protein